MWEDGFCRPRVAEDMDGEDPVRRAFSKMSIQLYNYGEGWVLGRCSRVQFPPPAVAAAGRTSLVKLWPVRVTGEDHQLPARPGSSKQAGKFARGRVPDVPSSPIRAW
jgi:hypothetical protein